MLSRVLLTFLAAWILWQIPVRTSKQVRLPVLRAVSTIDVSSKENQGAASKAERETGLVFFKKSAPSQYRIFRVSPAGKINAQFILPGESFVKEDQERVSFAHKAGFLTAPEDGAFFIWYPQIGSRIYFFDAKGQFLWEREESRYLQSFPSGRYILAAAGDHSRVMIVNPEFKTQADFQGVLLQHFNLDDRPNEGAQAQLCMASLDGEIIVGHIDKKKYARKKVSSLIKGLMCDFKHNRLAYVIEEKEVVEDKEKKTERFVDQLTVDSFSFDVATKKNGETIEMNAELILKKVLTVKLKSHLPQNRALVLTENFVCVNDVATVDQKPLLTSVSLSHSSHVASVDVAVFLKNPSSPIVPRGKILQKHNGTEFCAFYRPDSGFMLVNDVGLVGIYPEVHAERVVNTSQSIIIQTASQFLTF